MTVFIGTDEAGYGPYLGPLVISATAWQVPDCDADVDLYRRLNKVICRQPGTGRRVAIADSKALYSPGLGLQRLERGVFATLAALSHCVETWRAIWSTVTPRLDTSILNHPWHCTYDEPLPIDNDRTELDECTTRFCRGLTKAEVRMHAVEADAIFPCEFNRLVEQHGSKGAVLSQRTLELAQRIIETTEDSTIVVQCDKHGGRNCYLSILQPLFPEYLVEVVRESRPLSVYRWGPPSRRVEFRFAVNGESFMPTALASMYAKYLRELAMRAFNAFWQAHHESLKPTAGYSADARRFYSDISAKQQELAIAEHLVWRCR